MRLISKTKFSAEQKEYLGYWINRQGIQPIRNKIEAIHNIKAPKTRKEERTKPAYWYSQLLSRNAVSQEWANARFHWLASHQARSSVNGTHPIKRPLKKSRNLFEMRCLVLLCYPDFSNPVLFHLYNDALDHQESHWNGDTSLLSRLH
jgi:hypothetical protein